MGLITVTPVAGVLPKSTRMPCAKLVPMTSETVPPVVGPRDGVTEATDGALPSVMFA